MKIIALSRNDVFASNCFIIISGESFSVVDPSVGFEEASEICPEILTLKPCKVLLTHAHVDHFYDIETYTRLGCEVLVSAKDASLLDNVFMNCAVMLHSHYCGYNGPIREIKGGEVISLGDNEAEVICTPGHTAGSVCYRIGEKIFTGDTLFANGGYGRCDLPTGDERDLFNSLKQLFSLNGNITIYPGHGGISTLKETAEFF